MASSDVMGCEVTTSPLPIMSRKWLSSAGVAGNQVSEVPSVTADGRFVAFSSSADNLVPNQTNFAEDAFVRDRLTGTTERVSVATDGTQARYPSARPKASADGRYVVFDSFAPNLVPGDTNGLTDVFLRDRQAHTTVRISVSATGQQADGTSYGASMSPDGCFISEQPGPGGHQLRDGRVRQGHDDRRRAAGQRHQLRAAVRRGRQHRRRCRHVDERGRPVRDVRRPGHHRGRPALRP
jgi:hypothetical protein